MRIRRRYHLSYPGVLYIGVTIVLAIGAINSQNNLLFIALGLALGAVLVSGVMSGLMLMGLRAERDELLSGIVGGPLTIRYTITNRNRFVPAFGLIITELPGEQSSWMRRLRRLARAAGLHALLKRGPGRRSRSWVRRMSRPYACAAHVGPRALVRAEALVEPFRRGVAEFEGVRITSAFPFGILRKSVELEQESSVLVRPEVAHAPEQILRRIATAGDVGESESLRTGRGMDYHGLREYVPGDSMRQIAWRATARIGELVVRETEPPAASRVWVGVDLEPGDDDANERAISLGAGVLVRAIGAGLQVGLVVPALGVSRTPFGNSLKGESAARRLGMLLDDLARLDLERLDAEAPPAHSPVGRRDACIVIVAGRKPRGVWPHGAERLNAREPLEPDEQSVAPPSPARRAPEATHAEGAPG